MILVELGGSGDWNYCINLRWFQWNGIIAIVSVDWNYCNGFNGLEYCNTFSGLALLELRPILPAVIPLALLALWLAFPAVTPHIILMPLQPMARLVCRSRETPRRLQDLQAKFHFMHLKLAVTLKI